MSTAWAISDDALDAGRLARVVYTGAPLRSEIPAQYRGATRTQLPVSPGLRVLRDHIVQAFPIVRTTYMPGRSRPMVDSQRLDMHQTGRAVDFMVPMQGRSANRAGDALANYLVAHAETMGVQLVIWDRSVWSAGQPAARRFSAYHGEAAHDDHLHVEVSTAAAERSLNWYAQHGSTTSPSPADDAPAPYEGLGGPSPLAIGFAVAGAVALVAAVAYALTKARR